MQKRMEVSFPGNKRVDCHWGGLTVGTDQLKRNGGDETAPQPFDLFFAAIATCAGISALDFLQTRDLPTVGLRLVLTAELNKEVKRYDKVHIEITPPPELDRKWYDEMQFEAADCTVKRHIMNPPQFETSIA